MKCDKFLQQLDAFMRMNLRITKSMDDFYDDCFANPDAALMKIKLKIADVDQKRFNESLNIAGLKNIINNIESCKKKVCSEYHELRALIDDMEESNERLVLELDVAQKEAQVMIEQLADQDSLSVFKKSFQNKKDRAM